MLFFLDMDASYLQEMVMTKENGLTQWRDGENLVIHVEIPMMEVLLGSKNYFTVPKQFIKQKQEDCFIYK